MTVNIPMELEGGGYFELRAVEAETFVIANKLRWSPQAIYALPISERKRYFKAVTSMQEEHNRKMKEATSSKRTNRTRPVPQPKVK